MILRPIPALCILLLAGCASSEPQNAAYAPPADAQPSFAVAPNAAPPLPAAPYDQMGTAPTDGMLAAPAPQPGCSTVDGVTLCDAPYDPDADDRLYTN